ncbi:MAG: TonB-dependent receptor, partial [Bacteroides sp.]|uniref:SusC/RagA family TonB-linked outer membrane protein n=2 Tax=Bacteroides sp. TaxID=29523 RepID=UPI002FC68A4E
FIGYLPSQVSIAQKQDFAITLKEDLKILDEVVVVGYGSQKRESLTGAMQVMKQEKLLDVTSPSAENLLSGKAPGVYVNSGSGQPGSTGKIVIRGKATVNGGTDPLWVIDGVLVGDGSGHLNPADIESISVLKDASSTAIYGSMGANGVIVVTTKKGKIGKAVVNVSAKTGISQLNNGDFSVMNGSDLYAYYQSFSNQEAIQFSQYNEGLKDKNFNWWDCATGLGVAKDYNISASGGNEQIKSYISLGLYDESGAVKGYDLTRYNFRFNVDYQITDWLKIKPSVWGARRDIMNKQHSVGAMYSCLPWDSPYDEEGRLYQESQPKAWISPKMGNYLYNLQWDQTETTAYEFMGSFDFDIEITKWLTFSSVNNYKYGSSAQKSYVDPRSSGGKADNGLLTDLKSDYFRLYTNHLLRFNKTMGKHAVNGLIAYEFNSYKGTSTSQTASGFPAGFFVADVATTPKKTIGSCNEWAVQSYFLNGNYAYDNKYLAQLSIRRDGASNFGEHARYGTFFSISGGWNINRESFFKADWVNQLKLRASYGSVGARPQSLYPQYALYAITDGYSGRPGAMMSQIGNKDLTWEKTYTLGVGLDAILFDRLTLNFDWYQKKTTDLLYNVPVSAVVGWSINYKNVGEVNNKGVEATLGVDIIKNDNWNWNVSVNIAANKNQVKRLYGDKPEIIIGNAQSGVIGPSDKILKPGYDIDSWYTTEWAGVDQANGDPLWYMTDMEGNRVTTNNYAKASKTPVVCGSSNPDFYGGFSTSLSWKNIDLSTVFSYSVGGKIYNYMRMEFDSDGAYTDRNQMRLKEGWSRWQKEGDIATHPKPVYGNKSNSNSTSSRYLESASYLRLRNLTIGYNIPLRKYVSKLRVYASGENLFVVSGFSGIDPEVPPLNNGSGTGVATSVYPQTRKFMFGLNITL